MQLADAIQLKQLVIENTELKKKLAESIVKNRVIKKVNSRKHLDTISLQGCMKTIYLNPGNPWQNG